MLSFGVTHVVVGLIVFIVFVWAFVAIVGRIVNRAGYSRWWLLTLFVPVLNLIMLWIFAFADWPAARSRAAA